MILDLAVLAILVVPMARGIARGFIYSFVHTLGWIGSLVAAFLFTKPVAGFLADGFLGEMISGSIYDRLSASDQAVSNAVDGLPSIISGGITASYDSVSELFAGLLASSLISILTFGMLVFLTRFVLRIFVKPASKRGGEGPVAGADRLLGLVAGGLQGIILVFIFLALLVPAVNFAWTGLSTAIVDSLESSVVAGTLYDNNLLLVVTGGFFS